MKNKLNYFVVLLIVCIGLASCASMQEKKAAKHQPFQPHKNKKPKQGHPGSQQHH